MSILINPAVPVIAADAATADLVLTPGSVIDARVLRLLGNDQVRIAIGQATIDVQSDVALLPGQLLKLLVTQLADGLRLAIVGQQPGGASLAPEAATLAPAGARAAPPPIVPLNNQLTIAQAVAVAASAATAATRQGSLAPLFANLGIAADLEGLPPKLQQAIAQVLTLRPGLDANLRGSDLKAAFQASGLLMEASLAAAAPARVVTPDLKAALLVLRQVLVTSLGTGTAQLPATPSLTIATRPASTAAASASLALPLTQAATAATAAPAAAAAINSAPVTLPAATMPVIQETADDGAHRAINGPAATPGRAGQRAGAFNAAALMSQPSGAATLPLGSPVDVAMQGLLPALVGARRPGPIEDDDFARTPLPPPPTRGALPAAQPAARPTLASGLPLDTNLQQLLSDTEGAIARQALLQIASLPERIDAAAPRADHAAPRWHFEIPFALPGGTAIAQFEIARDGGGSESESAGRVWRARFSLDVEPAGPVHALVSLSGEKTAVRLWAERPATAAQLRDGAAELSHALSLADLRPGEIVIRHGAPPAPVSAAAGHFVDRAL